jgi:hypothetical protein
MNARKDTAEADGDVVRWLAALLADLEVIADWRDELLCRIQRAHLRFEFVGLDADEQEALAAEVAAFKQVCIALAGLLVGLDHEERRAA